MGCCSSTDEDGKKGNKRKKNRRVNHEDSQTPTEKGYKDMFSQKGAQRRFRDRLVAATAGKDWDELEKQIAVFEKAKLQDCGDLTKAKEKLTFLILRRDLRDAIRRRNVRVLDSAIASVQQSTYTSNLKQPLETAIELRDHLRELKTYSHDILLMEQSTISELRSYQRPPRCIHDVMIATYMLLGHEEEKLQEWTDIQSLMGKIMFRECLIKQIEAFDTSSIDKETTTRVKELLGRHSFDEVRAASSGAGTFHDWATSIIEKINKDGNKKI